MKAILFPNSNKVFKAPENMPDCDDLHVLDTGEMIISAWIPDAAELALLNAGHAVQLAIWGRAHPPVSVWVPIPDPEGKPS